MAGRRRARCYEDMSYFSAIGSDADVPRTANEMGLVLMKGTTCSRWDNTKRQAVRGRKLSIAGMRPRRSKQGQTLCARRRRDLELKIEDPFREHWARNIACYLATTNASYRRYLCLILAHSGLLRYSCVTTNRGLLTWDFRKPSRLYISPAHLRCSASIHSP